MDRNLQKYGLINLALLGLGTVALYAASRYTGAVSGQVTSIFLALGTLVAAVSTFQMRLAERERLEKLDFDEMARVGSGGSLFQSAKSEGLPARRAREQFGRYFVTGFTALLMLAEIGAAVWVWRALDRAIISPIEQPLLAVGMFGGLFLVFFLVGQFGAGVARIENDSLLRPSSNWLLLSAYLIAAAATGVLAAFAEFPHVDVWIARGLCVLLGLFALENLMSLVLEAYRPRVKGTQVRLLYDSRLLGLVSHPEGILTTAAHALDYQFGFKVSETWFYQFLQRAFAWLLLAQIGLLLLSTCVVFIEPGEEALLERFGKPIAARETLGPGAHFKLPWPIDRVQRFRTEQIQTFTVGVEADDHEHEEPRIILWTVSHFEKEYNFLVANRSGSVGAATNSATGKKAPPVSLLSGSVSFQFQIRDLRAWAYQYGDAAALLKKLATSEVVQYLVNADLAEVMSYGRERAAQTLKERLQQRVDNLKLGAHIIFVGLQDLHPPVKVASAFEELVGAGQKQRAMILRAEAYRIQANANAQGEAFIRVSLAESARLRTEVSAFARAALFTNQLPAFKAAPSVYRQRAYLQTFARASQNARKFILTMTNTEDVIEIDLQEKIGSGLTELPLPSVNPK